MKMEARALSKITALVYLIVVGKGAIPLMAKTGSFGPFKYECGYSAIVSAFLHIGAEGIGHDEGRTALDLHVDFEQRNFRI